MYCRSGSFLEGRVGISCRGAACAAGARCQGVRTAELRNGQRADGLVARSRSHQELGCADVLDTVMEKGKYIGMPTDYLREESSNCRASEDGDVVRNYRAPKSCGYVNLDLPGRFLRVSCET